MDISKSILSGQYNNIVSVPETIATIRGTGQFNSNFPLSSNWNPLSSSSSDPKSVQSHWVKQQQQKSVFPVYSSNWNFSSLSPVRKTKPDQWDLELHPSVDPYLQFGLQTNNETPTALNSLFFNKTNVGYLHKRLIEDVQQITGVKIQPQSDSNLLIIMNNKYQYSKTGFLPATSIVHLALPRGEKECSLIERLTRLNQSVLQEAVKQVLSGMNAYRGYYKHASSLPLPLEHPVLMSMKGGRVLSPNIGLTSGNSRGIDSFNLRNNIIN